MSRNFEAMPIENLIFVAETAIKRIEPRYFTKEKVELSREEKCVRGYVSKE